MEEAEEQIPHVQCISGILDLQKMCQRENLHFSEETNQYLLYQTLKKVGPVEAQKLISKMVERGDIEWQEDEDFEVENILAHVIEDNVSYYLIKWNGWSSQHNSWEPQQNLNCKDLIEAFHLANQNPTKLKKRHQSIVHNQEKMKYYTKKRRVDELFAQLVRSPLKDHISPLHLLSLSSPTKFKPLLYKGLITNREQKLPKFTISPNYSSKRTKSYKLKKQEIQKALKEWEQKLNCISIDPAPIRVENDVDLEGPPENFQYIVDYKAGEGIDIPQDPLVGCECTDCLHNKKGCCPSACGAEFAYYRYKRVRVPKGSPIYECNKRCLCGAECPNRVVQQGRKHKVSIFRTSNGRGWGVKALEKIKMGTFVMEYVGEVITNEEAERRGKIYDAECRTYLFDLDYNDGDCPFTVDAGYYGNVSHFVNHSCDPNLEVYGVWINTLDPRLPRIALFARRDIQKGEELTFDYMMTGDTTLQTASQVSVTDLPQDGQTTPKDKIFPISPRMDLKTTQTDSLSPPSETNESLEQPVMPFTEIASSDQSPRQQSRFHTKWISYSSSSTMFTPSRKSEKTPQKQSSSTTLESSENEILSQESPLITSANGSAENTASTAESNMEVPIPMQQQYRIVCQCGAANCRKYLF